MGSTGYTWHSAPDGGACYADGTGWIYVSNSEMSSGGGGASALRFNSSGSITGAYRILSGTTRNCSGGATPWGTWLSCEETDLGYVYETDPYGASAAVQRPAMGRFSHEAAAADLSWVTVPDPDCSPTRTRDEVSGMKVFNGGEGCYYRNGTCFFTTKGDNRVWAYKAVNNTIAIAYDDNLTSNPPLTGVDNITGGGVGDLYVAEDGGNMEVCTL